MKDLTYSEAITELDEIIEKMQSEECSIDNLNELTERSLKLLKICRTKLTATDEKLQEILKTLDAND